MGIISKFSFLLLVTWVLFLSFPHFSQAQDSENAEEDQIVEKSPQEIEEESSSGFINNLFFTAQFGGGTMASAGVGLAFLDNIVRPEILLGYTSGTGYSGLSVNAKLNARIIALPITEWLGIYATLGTSFTFFSSDTQIVSAAFIAEEFDFIDVLGIPCLSLYFEQDLYFVNTREGNLLFQLGIGLRASLF